MIWIAIVLLAVAVLAPLAVALDRHATARGAREMALDLHRSQLKELDRDLAEGRILPSEHATAVLEVQRRLLAVGDSIEGGTRIGPRWPVLATCVVVPLVAFGLYMVGGQPEMPSVTPGSEAAQAQKAMEEAALIDQLRDRLATMDPASEQGHRGYELLGNVEASRGNDAAAIKAWRTAMDARFDPALAVRIAQASERLEGGLSMSSESLLRRALAAAPPDAPWREAVEERLKLATPTSR
jgi:cytochrome c-type biogenesis protein CcmH